MSLPCPETPSILFSARGSLTIQTGLQALPQPLKPQRAAGVASLEALSSAEPFATQHHEAEQEGARGSARAGFKCWYLYFLRGICVPEAGLGSVDVAVNKIGPALLGLTFQYIRQTLKHRSPKPGYCLSVCNFPKKTPSGLAGVDMPFITHITGEYTNSGRSCKRLYLLQSEAHYKGSQTKKAHVLCMTLNYITSGCKRVKKQSQDKKPLPEGDKEGVIIHSQNNTFLLAIGCLTSTQSWEGKGHVH